MNIYEWIRTLLVFVVFLVVVDTSFRIQEIEAFMLHKINTEYVNIDGIHIPMLSEEALDDR